MRKTTSLVLAILAVAAMWTFVGCHDHDREKRSVTIETPESETHLELTHEDDDD